MQELSQTEQPSASLLATEARFFRQQERLINNFGFGDSEEALALQQRCYPALAAAMEAALDGHVFRVKNQHTQSETMVRLLQLVPYELLAVATLNAALQDVISDRPFNHTCQAVGKLVAHEVFREELRREDTELYKRAEAWAKRKHGALRYRLQSARSIAKRGGFTPSPRMKLRELTVIGAWCLDKLLETLPELFGLRDINGGKALGITDGAYALAEAAMRAGIRAHPLFLPSTEPCVPWTDYRNGGPADPVARKLGSLMRTHHKETVALVRAAIRDGSMKETLDALNAVQATPWRVNEAVLDVLIECHNRGIVVKGIPPLEDYAGPDFPDDWDALTDEQRAAYIKRVNSVKEANRGLISDRLRLVEDVETAKALLGDAFYTPCNIDWRGRVYPMTQFNFQREDRVRALFLFGEGEPIGEEGLYWLKVHVANCGDFDKISKQPYEERVRWTDKNLSMIEKVSSDAFSPSALTWWTGADKPFLFLSACLDFAAAMAKGSSYVSALPVSWDGSCSGLQHLCAMTRAEEGAFVNLTNLATPQDVYQTVATAAESTISMAAQSGIPYAQTVLDFGITRKVVKRNVMTYSYSSKKFGMAQQQMDDLMEPLRLEVLQGKREEHPFGDEWIDQQNASRFIASHVHAAIEQIVERPALAMEFLQQLAKALAHEGKALAWTTPTGLPWSNRYHEATSERLTLWMHDKGVKRRVDVSVASGFAKAIDKKRAANGVAPNFVHACDAAHLLLTVLAAVAAGLRHFALVHDSFGCLPSRAALFHKIIRATFVQMYEEHDVLAEVLECAKRDLSEDNHRRLPVPLAKGNLNIKEVMNAEYAFA